MFGKGKINISLPKTYYLPGDIISGDIKLELKKPVKAKEVSVSLIGEQKSTRIGTISSGGSGVSTTTQVVRIYDFKQTLEGEKEYSGGREYHFEIKIPADIIAPRPEGMLGTGMKIVEAAAALTGVIPHRQLKWYLSAKLDIPGGMDVGKKADITIG
jgi:hypothetical protein